MKTKKTPVRMCVACRRGREKQDLIRLVRTQDGTVQLDISGKANGRGAYMCRNADCIAKARQRKIVQRALGTGIADELYENLLELAVGTDDK